MNKKVYLFINKNKEHASELAKEIKRALEDYCYTITNDVYNADYVIGFGGDGTLIRYLKKVNYSPQGEYIGVNCGTLGFLQDFDVIDVKDFVKKIGTKYVSESLCLVDIVVTHNESTHVYTALNEFYIKNSNEKALRTAIKINNSLLENYVGTGLLFVTPTGSTARNLSAYGSILFPSMEAIQITPSEPNVAFHSLSNSIIVPKGSNIELYPNSNDRIKITGDGETVYNGYYDKITIKLSSKKLTRLVDLNYNFTDKIHKKFLQ